MSAKSVEGYSIIDYLRIVRGLVVRAPTLAVCLALLLTVASVHAGGPEWKVGLAQTKVTPEWPTPMSGYGGRTKPFDKVAADLFVKVMVLEYREGRRGVIVTSDLLGFPAAVAEPI